MKDLISLPLNGRKWKEIFGKLIMIWLNAHIFEIIMWGFLIEKNL